ncbi:MAG TPA: hypothetical protein VMT34_01230 [Aggregatilineales bacterium]|nr:hypothetical protein [Aggregatilineales bacterium]
MDSSLPDNAALRAFAREVPWTIVEENREHFQDYLNSIRSKRGSHPLALSSKIIWHLAGGYYDDPEDTPDGNVLLTRGLKRPLVLGTILGRRFQQGPWIDYVKPYNLNPSVTPENINEAGGPLRVRPVGTELEVGLVRPDGLEPTDDDLNRFHEAYIGHALRLSACLDVSPELCIYQAEVTVGPSLGFAKILHRTELNLAALTHAANEADLHLAVMSVYPTETDFATSHSDKVETVAKFLDDINESRPRQCDLLDALRRRYRMTRGEVRTSNVLRFQGYHMHVDLAGRSEALGLVSYMMNLGSASAVANAALLKGGPFMDGACDSDLLCTREIVRAISITGHYVDVPLSPHLSVEALEKHARLLRDNLANGTARALLYGEEDGLPYSGMHNMLGRVRPDLGSANRICTLESTGMATNPSAERLAAIAVDFQYSQLAIEHYFRQHGTALGAMFGDKDFHDVFGPLDRQTFEIMIDASDRLCTDLTLTTASGGTMSLVDFYEKKRRLLKRILSSLNVIDTRDIDSLYDHIYHFLVAPNGAAVTIDDYINHPTRRGTGNWGKILQNAYVAAGGTIGAKNPEAVARATAQLHDALQRRYGSM